MALGILQLYAPLPHILPTEGGLYQFGNPLPRQLHGQSSGVSEIRAVDF